LTATFFLRFACSFAIRFADPPSYFSIVCYVRLSHFNFLPKINETVAAQRFQRLLFDRKIHQKISKINIFKHIFPVLASR